MDIIDIVLARALTPQGQIESYATLAQKAITNAASAVTTAEQAASTAENAADAASAALVQLSGITQNITQAAHNEIDKLAFQLVTTSSSDVIQNAIKVTYPSEEEASITGITKYYKTYH